MSSDNTGYAEGFEAGRKAALALVRKWRDDAAEFPDTRSQMMKNICQNLSTAIAALPAPAGEEVTESDLHEFMLKHSEEWDSEEAAAQAIFSRFTILAKSTQEGQGS